MTAVTASQPVDDRVPLAVEDEVPTPPRPPRFAGFDGLRAIAAGTVVGVHVALVSGLTFRRPGVGIYTSRLEIGVAVFFLISGFLLYRPFAVAHLAAAKSPSTVSFWIRRLLRIVPVFWLALFVTTSVLHATSIGPGGWHAYVTQYLFAQIYFPDQVLKGISQAWTLDVEMSFYLFLPLYAALVGRRRARRSEGGRLAAELAGLGLLVAISVAFRFWVLANQHTSKMYELAISWLPAELDLFSLGMLLAVLSVWTHHRRREPRVFSRWWFPWLSWILAGVTFWGVAHLGVPTTVLYVKSDLDIARQSLYGLFAFFLLAPAVFGLEQRGLIRRFLQSWPMASLGVVSYGIYLWHQTLIAELIKYYPRLFGLKLFFNVAFWGMYGEILGASIVVATVSYFCLEKPVLRAKRWFAWFKQRPDASPAVEPPPAAPT